MALPPSYFSPQYFTSRCGRLLKWKQLPNHKMEVSSEARTLVLNHGLRPGKRDLAMLQHKFMAERSDGPEVSIAPSVSG
jgi:hypothetical protein